jgi:hypothetical protein
VVTTGQGITKLLQPVKTDKPGKKSASMLKIAALNLLKTKSHESVDRYGKKPKYEERDRGELLEGLYPGECGIFRTNGTVFLKTNENGVVSRKPVCGEPFREKDGCISVYEYGVLVHREELDGSIWVYENGVRMRRGEV